MSFGVCNVFIFTTKATSLSSPGLVLPTPTNILQFQNGARIATTIGETDIFLGILLMAEEGGGVESRTGKVEEVMEGVASLALLPCGSISGHFIQLPHSICYGLHGTELECERECSRGEDYRLIKLTITDFNTKKERALVVECRGHDAARFSSIDHAHGWEKDVVGMVEQRDGKNKISVSFACETLKSDKAAEDHIKQFLPKLAGLNAVVNIGKMSISGLDFGAAEEADLKQDV